MGDTAGGELGAAVICVAEFGIFAKQAGQVNQAASILTGIFSRFWQMGQEMKSATLTSPPARLP